MRSFNLLYWILWKDILSEIRNRAALVSMLFFALNIILIFSVSFSMSDLEEMMPGLIWTAFGFTAVIGLSTSFVAETHNQCLEYYRLLPTPKGMIYLGKLCGNLLFIVIVGLALLPLFVLFLGLHVRQLSWLIAVVFLGALGLANLGTLFSALTVNLRAREVLFPLLLLPLSVPVFIGATEATAGILRGAPQAAYRHWLDLLGIFDLIFTLLSFWMFEWILDE